MIDITAGTATRARSQQARTLGQGLAIAPRATVSAAHNSVEPPIDLATDREFRAWEALSDEVFGHWERSQAQGDDV